MNKIMSFYIFKSKFIVSRGYTIIHAYISSCAIYILCTYYVLHNIGKHRERARDFAAVRRVAARRRDVEGLVASSIGETRCIRRAVWKRGAGGKGRNKSSTGSTMVIKHSVLLTLKLHSYRDQCIPVFVTNRSTDAFQFSKKRQLILGRSSCENSPCVCANRALTDTVFVSWCLFSLSLSRFPVSTYECLMETTIF